MASRDEKARSAELTALACKRWETLSHLNLSVIAKLFREAIDLDPGNGAAFAGLSQALIAQGVLGVVRAPAAYASAEAALRRAREIDSELPDAKCADAWLKMVATRDWQGALKCFEDILTNQPDSTRAMAGRALLHIAEGYPDKASSLLSKAAQLHALGISVRAMYCWSEYLSGDYMHAIELVDQVRASVRTGPIVDAVEALTLIQTGEAKAHLARLEDLAVENPQHDVLRGALGYVYATMGKPQKANELLGVLTSPKTRMSSREPYAVAVALLGMNERQGAVQWLERCHMEGSAWSLGFRSDPILAPLRSDPHFVQLMSRISLPAPQPTSGSIRRSNPEVMELVAGA
jgi:thioredoxin-like negative regulator of GroEL